MLALKIMFLNSVDNWVLKRGLINEKEVLLLLLSLSFRSNQDNLLEEIDISTAVLMEGWWFSPKVRHKGY